MDKAYEVSIYIEQSVKGLRTENGYLGYIIETTINGKTALLEDYEYQANITAHEMELVAIRAALSRLTKPCIVTIYSGHGFFKNAFAQHWIDTWKQNDWKNAKGKPVEHTLIWKEIDKELSRHSVIIGTPEHKYQEKLQKEMKNRRNEYV